MIGLIVQDLVSNGHSWLNIKKYTLSEIGVFINSIYIKTNKDRVDNLSMGWMSSNLTQDGLKKTIKDMSGSFKLNKETASEEEIAKEYAKDWSRLASFKQKG